MHICAFKDEMFFTVTKWNCIKKFMHHVQSRNEITLSAGWKKSRTKSLKGYVDGNASFYFVVNLRSKTTTWCLVSMSSVWCITHRYNLDLSIFILEHMWISFSDKWLAGRRFGLSKKDRISKNIEFTLSCPILLQNLIDGWG